MKILYIGGSGTLGSALIPLLEMHCEVCAPSHTALDVTKMRGIIDNDIIKQRYDLVIFSAGLKNQKEIEDRGELGLYNNIIGTSNVVSYCMDYHMPLIYFSTGYVYKGDKPYHKEDDGLLPCNRYTWSKLGGECAVRMMPEDQYLIIRCEFSVPPWHTNYAFTDQFTSREKVGMIAARIHELIENDARGTFNVGGKRRSVWEYANSIATGKVLKCKMKDFATVNLPKDSSLNTSKYSRFIKEHYS